jgi:hypothetical protein
MLAAAVLFAVKVIYTGVVPVVPSAANTRLVRVVVPNGRVTNQNSPADVPSHVAYVMFDMKDLVLPSRQPDFTFTSNDPVTRQFGVILINSEFLALDGNFVKPELDFEQEPALDAVRPDGSNSASLHWMFNYTQNGVQLPALDTRVLLQQPDPEKVTLRMDLDFGSFAVEPDTISDKFAFIVSDDGECQSLARAVSLKMPSDVKFDRNELTLASTPFRGEVARFPLRLSRLRTDGDLKIVIGHEPVKELELSADLLDANTKPLAAAHIAAHPPGQLRRHMLLVQRLLTVANPPIFTPTRIPADQCTMLGKVKDSGNSGPQGMTGGCNPPVMPAADPPGL